MNKSLFFVCILFDLGPVTASAASEKKNKKISSVIVLQILVAFHVLFVLTFHWDCVRLLKAA